MRDKDVRAVLDKYLRGLYESDPSTLFLHELGVCSGVARVDMAVVNSHLAGYEIKSEADTLDRLPRQLGLYEKVFDEVTLVANERHTERLLSDLPSWCGIIEVPSAESGVCVVRPASANAHVEAVAVAQLLWRDEALDVLRAHGLDQGLRSKPRRVLWRALADGLPLDVLRSDVRSRLKARDSWRPDSQQTRDGARCRR